MPSAMPARSRSRSARSVVRGSARSGSVMARIVRVDRGLRADAWRRARDLGSPAESSSRRSGLSSGRPSHRSTGVVHMAVEKDPVCGMEVDTASTDLMLEHDGTTYWLCGRGCLLEFRDDPERFLADDYVPSM